MSKFKIGDKVKILKKNDSYSYLWRDGMDYTQETEGVVTGFDPNLDNYGPAYSVEVVDEYIWWYEEDWLEKVEENPMEQSTTWNNIEVGDLVVGRTSGKAFTVSGLRASSVHVEGGFIPHKDITAIYKKSWEKPKELEEMSKEELIKLVKQLKGEL